jgi:uncharacterized protein (DUF305 family)
MKQGMMDGKMKPGMSMGGMSTEAASYRLFGWNMLLSLVIMYFVMFTMIYSLGEFYNNLNMFYMALMMAAPMGALMLLMMRSMFTNRSLNGILYALFAAIFVLAYIGVRSQALVGDNQFLRSMIPHHSGAILMCEQASLKDPEIKSLCGSIIISQKQEIDQMKQLLRPR